MNKEWLDCLMEIPTLEYQNFKDSTKLNVKTELSKRFSPSDYSWLSVVEKYLPFLKNTIDYTSSLIIEEEDSKNSYENRFLYTLFRKLEDFLKKQYQILLEQEKSTDKSVLKLTGETTLEEEDISLELLLTVKKRLLDNKKSVSLQAKERMERIFNFLKPLKDGKFMKVLEEASLVRSPIRRSGLLVTHDNYKKLLELFEFLDSYTMFEKVLGVKGKSRDNNDFIIPYFMNYHLLSESHIFIEKDEEFLKKYLEGFIRQFVEESSIDEKSFKKMINKLFEEEYAKKKGREKNIQQIFIKSFDTYQKQVKDAIRYLKG